MSAFDARGEETISITRSAFELTMKSQYEAGFKAAVELLKNPDRDEFNAGITSCMHSPEWAAWLEKKKGGE
jgi:hypothetical protein